MRFLNSNWLRSRFPPWHYCWPPPQYESPVWNLTQNYSPDCPQLDTNLHSSVLAWHQKPDGYEVKLIYDQGPAKTKCKTYWASINPLRNFVRRAKTVGHFKTGIKLRITKMTEPFHIKQEIIKERTLDTYVRPVRRLWNISTREHNPR